jgi:HlyD family secretion protein
MPAPHDDIREVLALDAPAGRLAFLRQPWFWIAVIGVLVVGGGAIWALGIGQNKAIVYVTAPAKRADIAMTVTATGTVQPINQVDVGSELSGRIKSVLVDFNDKVKAGDLLAEIDTTKLATTTDKLQAVVDAAQASVTSADAALKEARQTLERIQPLATHDFSSEKDLNAAQSAYDRAVAAAQSARAQVKGAEADLAANQVDLSKSEIRSPINGIVLTRSIDPGQTVAATLSAPVLFTIAEDLTKMNLLVDVDEADAGVVRAGETAQISVEAYTDRKFPAKVEQLRYAPETVNGVVSYKAVLSVDNSELLLRPGMTVTAEIVAKTAVTALAVPNAGLRYAPPASTAANAPKDVALAADQKRLYVLKAGQATPVIITPGLSDGNFTEVLKGDIAAGDAVITGTGTAK